MENIAIARPAFDQKKIKIFFLDHIIELCLIVLIIALAFSANGFMSWANWMNILRANSLKGVIAFGMTMAMIAGLIDLSIGSTVALAGVIVALACRELTGVGIDIQRRLYHRDRDLPGAGLRDRLVPWLFPASHGHGSPAGHACQSVCPVWSGGPALRRVPDCQSIPGMVQPVGRRKDRRDKRDPDPGPGPGAGLCGDLVHHGLYHHRAGDLCHRRQP